MKPDFSLAAADYHAHRPAFVPGIYDRLRQFAALLPGQRVLDLAAGTGLFSRPLQNVCEVVCVDQHRELVSECVGHCVVGQAEALPFANDSFDCVVAAQCWHWLDRHAAPGEILRVLRPGACLAVVYMTYVPLPGSVAEASERVILRHHPGWRHANSTGVNGQALRDVQIAGFVGIESFSFDVTIEFPRHAWHGYIRTTSPVAPTMTADQLKRFDEDHVRLLDGFADSLSVPHRVFCIIARKSSCG